MNEIEDLFSTILPALPFLLGLGLDVVLVFVFKVILKKDTLFYGMSGLFIALVALAMILIGIRFHLTVLNAMGFGLSICVVVNALLELKGRIQKQALSLRLLYVLVSINANIFV